MIRYYSVEYKNADDQQKVRRKSKGDSVIPKLLCAARTQDEDTIRSVLKNLLQDGVDEEDINTVDCSGRVSRFPGNIQWNCNYDAHLDLCPHLCVLEHHGKTARRFYCVPCLLLFFVLFTILFKHLMFYVICIR